MFNYEFLIFMFTSSLCLYYDTSSLKMLGGISVKVQGGIYFNKNGIEGGVRKLCIILFQINTQFPYSSLQCFSSGSGWIRIIWPGPEITYFVKYT